jgi:UDP-N-acetylmuramate dehydrogenase
VVDVTAAVKKRLRKLQSENHIEFHERVGLREWTTLRVGGAADLLIRCSTTSAVQQVVDLLASHGIGWLVLGAGSRLVPPDVGVRVPVLKLTGDLARWEVDLDGLVAGAGAKLTQVGGSVARAGLSGMERLFGAPGSVGGAIQSTATAHGADLGALVEWVETVIPGQPAERFLGADILEEPGRAAVHEHRRVVVRARFGLRADQLAAIRARIAARNGGGGGWRMRCASPAFLAPPGHHVGGLIGEAGCSGLKSGGAQVSNQISNAIVTGRIATAIDVLELSRKVVDTVQEKCGVTLSFALCFVDQHGHGLEP